MITALVVAQIFCWLVIAALVVALLALARQVGVLHVRLAPAGALTPARGPAAGEKAPQLSLTALDGAAVSVGRPASALRRQLLLFVSPHCPICKELIPVAKNFVKREGLEIVFLGDDNEQELRAMAARMSMEGLALVNDSTVGRLFHVDKLPHAVLVDGDGTILAKGLVNSREHLESLVVSQEMGVVSVQDYLAKLNSKVA